MKRKPSAFSKIISNLNRLLPFVGFLMVIAGIVGLIFIQKPLNQTQELRSEASENQNSWPTITATNQNLYIDENSEIYLDINTGNKEVKSINSIFNIITKEVSDLTITVDANSDLRADGIEVERIDDGYLVKLKAVPRSGWNSSNSNISFLKINFTPLEEGSLSINFDEDNTYIETSSLAYAIDSQTINFDIKEMQNDDDDNSNDNELVIRECNEKCGSNMDCAVNYRCFDTGSEKRCRLATNPSSSECSAPPNLGPNKQCNEYCADSNDCTQGLSCWYNECRNPNNVENTNCADLTQKEEVASTNSCGEYCSSNADCAINLRCYENECRLVTNPSSLTCSAITQKTISPIYEDNQEESGSSAPLKKGDNVIPDSESNYQGTKNIKSTDIVNALLDDDVPVDETAFDFLVKMLKDKQQSLPTTVILIGVGLLAASLIVLLASKLFGRKSSYSRLDSKSESKPVDKSVTNPTTNLTNKPISSSGPTQIMKPIVTPTTTPQPSQDTRVKDLLEKIKEQSKNQNQG